MTLPLLALLEPVAGLMDVRLRCPSCQHEWHAATIDLGSWWGKGLTAEGTAQMCYCPSCSMKPPMGVVEG